MQFSQGLQELKARINNYSQAEVRKQNQAFQKIKERVQQITDKSPAYCVFSEMKSLTPTRENAPWGFIYGYDLIPGLSGKEDAIKMPKIHPFINVAATAIDEDGPCSSLLLDFALRSILSYPVGDCLVYLLDANVSGSFNQLSEISTHLDDIDSEKNHYHYITMPSERAILMKQLFVDRDTNIRKCVSKYQDVYSYNLLKGGPHVPLQFVFIRDINQAMTNDEKEKLLELISHGNATRAGIYVFFSYHKKDLEDLNSHTMSPNLIKRLVDYSAQLSKLIPLSRKSTVHISPKIGNKEIQATLDYVKNQKPNSAFVTFRDQIKAKLEQGRLWSSPVKGQQKYYLHIPVGFSDDASIMTLNFPFNVGSPHGYVGGKTGSGKSILLHNIILNASIRYSPEQLRFYLIDLKGGVSFVHYSKLPHVAALSASSEEAFALSVLDMFCSEIDRRGKLFRRFGVTLLEDYNEKAVAKGIPPLPYLMCVIDEYQRLLQDAVKSQLPQTFFGRIHAQARAYGIFLILCTQSLGSAQTNIKQVGMKMSLIASRDDSQKLIGNESAAKLRGIGRAILNTTETGDERQNQEFQVAYIDEAKELPTYIDQIQSIYLKQNNGVDKLEHIIYNDNDLNARIADNHSMGHSSSSDLKKIYIGRPCFCQSEHIGFNFHHDTNSNLLVVGTDRSSALRLTGIVALQFCQQYGNVGGHVYLLDLQRRNSRSYGKLAFLGKSSQISYSESDKVAETIGIVYQMLSDRIAVSGSSSAFSEILLAITDIRQMPAFNQGTSGSGFVDFSDMGGFGTSSKPDKSVIQKLRSLITDGPEYGIHVMAYGYNFANIDSILDRGMRSSFEIKIGLRGTDASTILYGINCGDITSQEGQGRLLMPTEMGLHFDDGNTPGDPFIVYNQTGNPDLEKTPWGELFHNLPNVTEII